MADEEKKKVIIALWGPQDTGKTTTLRKLAQEFLKSITMEADLQVIFSYSGKKIAISTGEDYEGKFEKYITSYNSKEWKSAIFATPTRTEELRSFISSSNENKEVSALLYKLSPDSQNSNNATTLRKLSRVFLNLIEEDADIQISFLYKIYKEDKRIVISTAGDDGKTVKEGADLFKALGADILVTATRTRRKAEDQDDKDKTDDKDVSSIKALEDLEQDKKVRTKAVWIYKSYLTYGKENHVGNTVLQESIDKEQIETIRNTIHEEQAKTIKLVIDNIIEKWEKKAKGNSASSAPTSK